MKIEGSFSARFAWLDAVSRDPRMPGLAIKVAVQLAANYFHSNTGAAWPSQTLLAERLGADRRSIQRALDALVDGKWLRRVRTKADGRFKSNNYFMAGAVRRPAVSTPRGAEARSSGADAASIAVSTPPNLGEEISGNISGSAPLDFDSSSLEKRTAGFRRYTSKGGLGFEGGVRGLEEWYHSRQQERRRSKNGSGD